MDMPFKVRELHPDETRTFLEVHHAAISATAAADYPAEVIEAWSPLPITDAFVQHVRNSHEGEIRLAASLDGEIIGIGALVPQNHELRACYVSPEHGRLGAGRALVEAIEHIAQQRGLTYLAMDSSITAERFYLRLGYKVVGRGEHNGENSLPTRSTLERDLERRHGWTWLSRRKVPMTALSGRRCSDTSILKKNYR